MPKCGFAERDRPGRRSERPVANIPQTRSAGRRPPRAGRTRSPSAIIKRKPLSSTARRAGWVGCNFALNRIPADARIAVVTESQVFPAAEVREKFKRIKPLKEISVTQRGWTVAAFGRKPPYSLRRSAETPLRPRRLASADGGKTP